jgi:hypothetical protein
MFQYERPQTFNDFRHGLHVLWLIRIAFGDMGAELLKALIFHFISPVSERLSANGPILPN